ncbi:hypothetical protein [Brevundimonas sp.]|uniref:hypothetical protein n=1 Tax=Brevundimonas sp. TaxID=1871086 RepID=UPI0028A15D7A|nr:hypothetical protein [Brevundimonas sp.]
MRVKASEISADYVRGLRQRNRSWSVIARMTGASEIDLRRYHGGMAVECAAPSQPRLPVAAAPVMAPMPVRAVRVVGKPKPVPKPKAKRVRKVAAKPVSRKPTKADLRLSAVLVAAGMGMEEAGMVVRMYRAGGKRLTADALVPAGVRSPNLTKQRMASAKASAARLGIKFSGGRGGYCLRPDSLHFVGRLEAVNCGGVQ